MYKRTASYRISVGQKSIKSSFDSHLELISRTKTDEDEIKTKSDEHEDCTTLLSMGEYGAKDNASSCLAEATVVESIYEKCDRIVREFFDDVEPIRRERDEYLHKTYLNRLEMNEYRFGIKDLDEKIAEVEEKLREHEAGTLAAMSKNKTCDIKKSKSADAIKLKSKIAEEGNLIVVCDDIDELKSMKKSFLIEENRQEVGLWERAAQRFLEMRKKLKR